MRASRAAPSYPADEELARCYALCPLPMALFDDNGAVLKSNEAFRALSVRPLVSLHEAGTALRQLLSWEKPLHADGGRTGDALRHTAEGQVVATEASLVDPEGRTRWLQGRITPLRGSPGTARRYLVLLDDRSAEQERDVARQQVGALMDTAGVGLATFQQHTGWLRPDAAEGARGAPTGLQGISRDIVEPDSLPEYERLQRALKKGQRTEVRYAVRHPELGRRWLLTRVEPGELASGERTTSVVTLDLTTQQQAEDRSEQLQHELTQQTERERTVLDSVLVGIVTVGRKGIEWMNRSARRMFGDDLEAFLGQPMSIVATDDPDHPFRRRSDYAEAAGEAAPSETFECRLKARDGREFWVVGNAVVTGSLASGRQVTYALLDIERRRQAEARELQAQASLSRIIEAAPLAISLHDAGTLAVEQINQTAAALAGRTEAELIGAGPDALFGEALAAQVREDMHAAVAHGGVTQREYQLGSAGHTRVWDTRFLHLPRSGDDAGTPEQLLMVASDVTEQRAAEEARLEAAIAQRELLVREVHHRIKNNLQGVAGLLQQIAARRPEVAPVISEAVGQVNAIAQVYGLQVGASGPLRLRRVVEAIIGSVKRMSGRAIASRVDGPEAEADAWSLPEAEAIPIALTLNELLTNAIKHSAGSEVCCTLVCGGNSVAVEIVNPGQLPEGFELDALPGGVSGLGLVRALLPRRSALLSMSQQGEDVVCRVDLYPPSVSLAPT